MIKCKISYWNLVRDLHLWGDNFILHAGEIIWFKIYTIKVLLVPLLSKK